MKFSSFAAAALALALPAIAQTSQALTYSPKYDDASLPMTAVACSDGPNGLVTKGFNALGSLPGFPYIGGVDAVTGWNSPECGTCHNITYGDSTLLVLAVDVALYGLNLSEEGMDALTHGRAAELGMVDATSVQVDTIHCGF